MPRAGVIAALDDEARRQLDDLIINNRFGNYAELVEVLRDRFGLEISRSRLAVHGKRLKDHVERLRVATDMARQMEAAAADEDCSLDTAAVRFLQERVFNYLYENDELELDEMRKLSGILAPLMKQMTERRKWSADQKRKIAAAANETDKQLSLSGADKEIREKIQRLLLGISDESAA